MDDPIYSNWQPKAVFGLLMNKTNHSRSLKGWFSPEGLLKMWEQDIDSSDEKLKNSNPDFLRDKNGLSLRDYQMKAIDRVEQTILNSPETKRMLLAMATGTGKTRTIIGLAYRLVQSHRFRRILFMVDRWLLAKQALDHFVDDKIEDLNTFAEIYKLEGLKVRPLIQKPGCILQPFKVW